MMSSCAGMNWRKLPAPDNPPFLCNPSAYIDKTEYEIPDLTSKDDKVFHLWAGNVIRKYPVVLDSYLSLRECVERYHPEVKKL